MKKIYSATEVDYISMPNLDRAIAECKNNEFFEDSDFQYRIEKRNDGEDWYVIYLYDRNESIGYDEYINYSAVDRQFEVFTKAVIEDTGYTDFYFEPYNNVEFSGGFEYYMIDESNVRSYVRKLVENVEDAEYKLRDAQSILQGLRTSGQLLVQDADAEILKDAIAGCDTLFEVILDAWDTQHNKG